MKIIILPVLAFITSNSTDRLPAVVDGKTERIYGKKLVNKVFPR